jgi:tetratricopeptide (TPR) repeat protein
MVRAAPKEKQMKRTIPLWLGLLAFALLPALAETPKGPTGKIHGHITNPAGAPQSGGTVNMIGVTAASGPGLSGKSVDKGSFPVDANGDYSGDVEPGNYDVVYRSPGTPADKVTDRFDNIKILTGHDVVQDFDMTRKEYVDKLTPEERKQLEELRKKNSEAMKANEIIKGLNADLKLATQDFKDADTAQAAAQQALGAGASRSDIEAKEAEIKVAKYTEIETMMLKDTGAKPDASVLWAQLGQAQLGLGRVKNDAKKYEDAITAFKKVIELEAVSKKPNLSTQGVAHAGIGEVYARTGKIPEANAAFDEAAKVDPAQAVFFLKNEMVIFFQTSNADAQVAAADAVIKADPTVALAYYLKGNGLVGKSTVDPKTNKLIPPPGCQEAYEKYLQLAPTGQYAGDVKSILTSLQATLPANVTAKPSKKK